MEERRDLKCSDSSVTTKARDWWSTHSSLLLLPLLSIVAMIFLRGQLQNIFSNIGNNLT